MSSRGRLSSPDDGLTPDEMEAERLRFTREHGHHGPSLAERIAEQLDRLHFRSPLHRMRLKGRFPLKLLAVPEDPVPGDPKSGARLKAGRLFHSGFGQAIAEARLDDPAAPAGWHGWVHGWLWLRDAAAAGPLGRSEAGRIEGLCRRWLTTFADYDPLAWAPDRTGQRILMAVSHAPLVMAGHDHVHRSAVLNAIARWTRHLERAAPRVPPGLVQVQALAGLVGGQLILPGNEGRAEKALQQLDSAVAALLLAGGHLPSRCPLDLAELGDLLLFLAAFHRARSQSVSEPVERHLRQVRESLAALAEGDGVPAGWHGGQAAPAQMARLGARPRADAMPSAASGYRKMAAGQTVLMLDAGPPPPARASDHGHASTLAFTLSDGAAPLIVSCGAARGVGPDGAIARTLPAELAEGLRTTAAHSTLVLADTNSTRLADNGPRRQGGVGTVLVETRATADGQWVEASHDGWRRRFGFDHVRRLWLAADGDDLRGEDALVRVRSGLRLGGPAALPVSVRFHLAPGCEAVPTQDGMGVLVRTRSGRAWSFRARFASMAGRVLVEPSIHVDAEGHVETIQQIHLLSETAPGKATRIGWSFRRGAATRQAVPRRTG
jgi:uncharacterized heparinase superfamily protein